MPTILDWQLSSESELWNNIEQFGLGRSEIDNVESWAGKFKTDQEFPYYS